MSEPPPAPAPRPPQTAVTPLDNITAADLQAGTDTFDRWLQKATGNVVTLERLTSVLAALPVTGNVMALVDTLRELVEIVRKLVAKQTVELLEWASIAINLIGVIPAPGTAAARMSLRPALHLVRQKLSMPALKRNASALGEAVCSVLVTHLSDTQAGELEHFAKEASARLAGLLEECGKTADQIIDALVDVLRRVLGEKPLLDLAKPVVPAKRLYDPEIESTAAELLLGALRLYRRAVNKVAAVASQYLLPGPVAAELRDIVRGLEAAKPQLRAALVRMGDASTEQSLQWMLQQLIVAVGRCRRDKALLISRKHGARDIEDRPGHKLGAIGKEKKPKRDPNPTIACPAKTGTGCSISYATGSESLGQDDFELAAPLPIVWTRSYRSSLAAYDRGALGARWIGPYTTRVDVIERGAPARPAALLYHGADGRSHRYPWLEIGQQHHDPVEELTLTRHDTRLLTIDAGKPRPAGQPPAWRESYELIETDAGRRAAPARHHFRLIALHDDLGASIGLRYDHSVGDLAVLSDIVSRHGETIVAHVGIEPDAQTGLIRGLWEIRDGQLVRQLDAYQHYEHGDLVAAQDETGAARRYAYGRGDDGASDHLLVRYADRSGRGMNVAYDGHASEAKAVREWADDGSLDTRLEWDPDIRLTYVTDAMGQETWVYCDGAGYPYRVIHPDQREEWFFRDAAKRVTRHVRPDGASDDFHYDAHGNLVRHVRADSTRVHYEYDRSHRLVGMLDADGGIWRRELDLRGLVEQETDPLGHATRYEHDAAARPLRIVDAKGGTKTLTYTPQGRLASFSDCTGSTTRWTYDTHGRLATRTDALGQVTAYRYTPVSAETLARASDGSANHPGWLQAIVHPDGSEEQFRHDAEGRLLAHVDALQRTTRYAWDPAGRVAERIDALGHRLAYRWDALGRLVELRNENGQPYRFAYDPVGRLLQEIGFDRRAIDYRYDEMTGRLAEVQDGSARTQLVFDRMDRLQQRSAQLGDGAAQVERFGYTPGGRLGEAANAHMRLLWEYDAAGNLVREDQQPLGELADGQRTAVWRHRYDELNVRVGTTRPDGHALDWLTYGSGHVHGLLLDGREVVAFERDALHREVLRRQANGLVQHQRYDTMGRLVEQRLQPGDYRGPTEMDTGPFVYRGEGRTPAGPAAILRRYRYDAAGQLLTIGDSRRGQIDYRYDPVGQLLEATSALGREVFAFDPAGNIGIPQPAGRALGPGTVPRVLDNLIKAYAGTHYRYDDRGNVIERLHHGERASFEWDGFGRMVGAVTPRGVARYAYDALGRRVAKRVERDGAGWTTRFGWDGDTLAWEQRDEAGRQDEAVHYVYEAGSFVPLLRLRSTASDISASVADHGLAYFHCDHLGTPQELTDWHGSVAWSVRQRVWGEARVTIADAAVNATIQNPLRFQGQYLDNETGLHYNRNRYYDAATTRFTSRDPLGIAGGLNAYFYASNPISWIDALGLKSCRQGRFRTMDGAANAALIRYTQKSIRDNKEYGGLIYMTSDGRFDFTKAIRGEKDVVNPWADSAPKPPGCSREVGYWHTHGDHSDKLGNRTTAEKDYYRSNEFSQEDKNAAIAGLDEFTDYRGYLGTPSAGNKGFQARSRRVYRI